MCTPTQVHKYSASLLQDDRFRQSLFRCVWQSCPTEFEISRCHCTMHAAQVLGNITRNPRVHQSHRPPPHSSPSIFPLRGHGCRGGRGRCASTILNTLSPGKHVTDRVLRLPLSPCPSSPRWITRARLYVLCHLTSAYGRSLGVQRAQHTHTKSNDRLTRHPRRPWYYIWRPVTIAVELPSQLADTTGDTSIGSPDLPAGRSRYSRCIEPIRTPRPSRRWLVSMASQARRLARGPSCTTSSREYSKAATTMSPNLGLVPIQILGPAGLDSVA